MPACLLLLSPLLPLLQVGLLLLGCLVASAFSVTCPVVLLPSLATFLLAWLAWRWALLYV